MKKVLQTETKIVIQIVVIAIECACPLLIIFDLFHPYIYLTKILYAIVLLKN
jgi:hypothetical protein